MRHSRADQFSHVQTPNLPFKSVCDTCPAIRKGKGDITAIKRFTGNPEYAPDKGVDQMRCLLEQWYLCTDPITQAGCAGNNDEAPRSISARAPCRGYYGGVRQDGNQLLDMLNVLAPNGIDISSIPDRNSLLQFSSAHNRLAPSIKGDKYKNGKKQSHRPLVTHGNVASVTTHFHSIREVEKYVLGKPAGEVTRIVTRICGICPWHHHLSSTKIESLRLYPPPFHRLNWKRSENNSNALPSILCFIIGSDLSSWYMPVKRPLNFLWIQPVAEKKRG